MQMLYTLVLGDLGGTVLQLSIFDQIKEDNFSNKKGINKNLLIYNPVEDDIAKKLYNDQNYGLNNSENYINWNSFLDLLDNDKNVDPLAKVTW